MASSHAQNGNGSARYAAVGPSRFTHLGRHLGGISLLFALCPEAHHTALLGSGPVEPFAFAEVFSRSVKTDGGTITAVDTDAGVTQVLSRLLRGEPVATLELAELCRDDFDDPSSPANTNFGVRLVEGLAEFTARSLAAPFDLIDGRLTAAMPPPVKCTCVQNDALRFLEALESESVDLMYIGLVLNQIRKRHGRDSIGRLLMEAERCLAETGVMGIGASLSPAHGLPHDVSDIAESGFRLLYVSLENLIFSGGQYYGDYGLAITASGREYPQLRLALDGGVAAQLDADLHEVAGDELSASIREYMGGGRIVVGAVPVEGRWQVASIEVADVDRLCSPERRLWFDAVRCGDELAVQGDQRHDVAGAIV